MKPVLPLWREFGVMRALEFPDVACGLLTEPSSRAVLFHVSATHSLPLSYFEELVAPVWAWYVCARHG